MLDDDAFFTFPPDSRHYRTTVDPFSIGRLRVIMSIEETTMRRHAVYEFDNRDSAQVYEYMEARIEALKRRIEQLEAENDALRAKSPAIA
jgi:hypothetical protein